MAEKKKYTMSRQAIQARQLGGLRLHELSLSGDGEEVQLAKFAVEVARIRVGADLEDPESLYVRFVQYLELCAKTGRRVGNMGAYSAMGITLMTAHDWQSGRRRASDPRYKELIDLVQSVCASYREELMASGKINPAVGIFWQKNYDHLADTQTLQLKPENPMGEEQDARLIAEKYKDIEE